MPNHHDHQHDHPADTGDAALAELLDLDAEVLRAYLSEVIDWVRDLAGDPPPRRILDLGAGTGNGALALARRFADAEVIALDLSAPLLERLRDKAGRLGVAGRIQTVRADLDAAWPAVGGPAVGGPVDLAWAANSLHHLADPDRVLTDVFGAIRPGGLLAVVELDSFPRFLPADLGAGRPGLEERCHAALAEAHSAELPHLGSDWGPRLAKAGFTVEAQRRFTIDLSAPLPSAAGRYAQATLRRMRTGLESQLAADDLATLDTLIDEHGPGSVLRRDDLTVRATRTGWAARRPA
jgi:SAM-dependent methyltransferase